jgi:hypothetical protein
MHRLKGTGVKDERSSAQTKLRCFQRHRQNKTVNTSGYSLGHRTHANEIIGPDPAVSERSIYILRISGIQKSGAWIVLLLFLQLSCFLSLHR